MEEQWGASSFLAFVHEKAGPGHCSDFLESILSMVLLLFLNNVTHLCLSSWTEVCSWAVVLVGWCQRRRPLWSRSCGSLSLTLDTILDCCDGSEVEEWGWGRHCGQSYGTETYHAVQWSSISFKLSLLSIFTCS